MYISAVKYDPLIHNRHSIRLRNFDYANAGAYFVTICLNQRIPKLWRYDAKPVATDSQFVAGQPQSNSGQPRRVAPTEIHAKYDFPIFGTIENGAMVLNDYGKMARQTWNEISEHYSDIGFAEFIVMPDHIHGIITISGENVGATLRGCPATKCGCPELECERSATNYACSLPNLVYGFKTRTTNKYINGVKISNWLPFNKRLWQRNYYEHIIRSEAEYAKIAEYINNNPILWQKGHLDTILM